MVIRMDMEMVILMEWTQNSMNMLMATVMLMLMVIMMMSSIDTLITFRPSKIYFEQF